MVPFVTGVAALLLALCAIMILRAQMKNARHARRRLDAIHKNLLAIGDVDPLSELRIVLADIRAAFQLKAVHLLELDERLSVILRTLDSGAGQSAEQLSLSRVIEKIRDGVDPALVSEPAWIVRSHPAAVIAVARMKSCSRLVALVPDGRMPDRFHQRLLRLSQMFAMALERQCLLEQLRHAEKRADVAERLETFSALTGNLTHGLNNSLAAILGYSEMIAEDARPGLPLYNYIEEVLEAARTAMTSIGQIITFRRMGGMSTCPLDPLEIARGIRPALLASIPSSVTLSLDESATPVVIDSNPNELGVLLIEICKFASRHLDEGSISIMACRAEEQSGRTLSHGTLKAGGYVRIGIRYRNANPQDYGEQAERVTLAQSDHLDRITATVRLLQGVLDMEATQSHMELDLYFKPSRDPIRQRQPDADFLQTGSGELVVVVDPELPSRLAWEEKVAEFGYEPLGVQDVPALAEWLERNTIEPDLLLVASHDRPDNVAASLADNYPLRTPWICIASSSLPADMAQSAGLLPADATDAQIAKALAEALGKTALSSL